MHTQIVLVGSMTFPMKSGTFFALSLMMNMKGRSTTTSSLS